LNEEEKEIKEKSKTITIIPDYKFFKR